MAQTLREGCTYSLVTEEGNYEKRKVYFVKLTDSCLKAIEEYTDGFKSGSNMKSIIRFDDAQGGAITIPNSAMKGSKKTFVFGISNVITSDKNPLQECIKCTWKSNCLVSYGPLEQKISIAATDDCYENTKNRMAQVDQERKDIRTKEIKLGSMKKGRKTSKMVVPDSHKMSSGKNVQKVNSRPITSSSKPHSSSTTHSLPVVTQKKSPLKKSPKSSTGMVNSPSTGGKEFTCRDRVMHILSLRPYKKPELVLRLQREGMSQKDRGNLAMVLQQVASFSDNQYTLLSHLFADLRVDSWPFFNENEKNIVKKNIASTPHKKTDTTSSQLVSSTSKSPEDKLLSKRPLPTAKNHVINKKQKIESNEQPSSTSISPNENASVSSTSNENEALGRESPQTVASTSDCPDYLMIYKSITTKEQRFQYKRDFQLEYEEYTRLKKYLDGVTSKFMELENSLKSTVEGSPEYVKIQNEILDTYNKQQQDEKYGRTKCRYENLTKKLSHIKKLVMEYDSSIGNS